MGSQVRVVMWKGDQAVGSLVSNDVDRASELGRLYRKYGTPCNRVDREDGGVFLLWNSRDGLQIVASLLPSELWAAPAPAGA